MQTEFTVGGHTYRTTGKIDARKQFHIVRRLVPAFAGLLSAADVAEVAKGGAAGLLSKVQPFVEAVSRMPDDDVDYVLDNCLAIVQRKIEGDRGWAAVRSAGGGMMFEDIGLAEMLQLAFEVLKDNLQGFFDALPSTSPEA